MAFIDDIKAANARLATAQATATTERQAAVDQLTTVLFNRLRPAAALDWATDPVLQEACRAFALSVIQGATQ